MGVLVAITAALLLWIVLWATGTKALDAMMLAMLIAVLAAMGQLVARNLPGRRS